MTLRLVPRSATPTRSDPPDAQRLPHHAQRRKNVVPRRHLSRPRTNAQARQRLGLQRPGGHNDLALLHRPPRGEPSLYRLHGPRLRRSLDAGQTWIWWDKNSWAPWRNTCYEIAFDPAVPGKMWGAFLRRPRHSERQHHLRAARSQRPRRRVRLARFRRLLEAGGKGSPTARDLNRARPTQSAGNRTLYAGVFMEGVYKSTDDGKTWTLKKRAWATRRTCACLA